MRNPFAIIGLFLIALTAACGYDPHPKDGALPCTSHCPDGYTCENSFCRLNNPPGGGGAGGIPAMGGTGGISATGGTGGGGSGGSSIPLIGTCANLTCLNPLVDLLSNPSCQVGATEACTRQTTIATLIVINDCYTSGMKTRTLMASDFSSATVTVKSSSSVCYSMAVSGLLGNVNTIVVRNSSGATVATLAVDSTTKAGTITCPGGIPTVIDATCGSATGSTATVAVPGSGATCTDGTCAF